MTPTITIDSTKFNSDVLALSVALGKDASIVAQDEARLLLQQCIRLAWPKTPKQGKKAVMRDIRRAALPMSEDIFESEALKKVARRNDPNAMRDTLEKIPGWKKWRVEPFTPSLHQKARDRRGRVQRGQRVIAYPKQDVNAYIKAKQQNVGRQRAGWAPAFLKFGGKLSAWVRRHVSGARGFVTDMTDNKTKPGFEAGNFALGIGATEAGVRKAMRVRQSAVARRLKLILSGYSADMARGMRAQSRARRTSKGATA